jgi:cysteine desulfurase
VIYLDHNATTPLDPRVLDAMLPYLRGGFGNASSPHNLGRQARIAVETARARLAGCLGALPDEIIFTSGGSESDNLALRGVVRAGRAAASHLVSSAIEHHAVLATCRDLETQGCRVALLPVDRDGVVVLDELRRATSRPTLLVSIMAANNETGVIQPLARISEITRERGALLHTDAVQALGKLPLSLDASGVDLASFSAHKLGGPKGVGILYVRRGTPLAPTLTGGRQERDLRAGTENVAGIVGLAEAVALAIAELDKDTVRLAGLRARLEQGILAGLDGVTVNGAAAARVANTANVSFRAVDGESIVLQLDLEDVCVSTGSACTTGEPEPSHVLLAMGVDPILARGAIRFSLGKGTTEAEIDNVVTGVVAAVKRLRAVSSLD